MNIHPANLDDQTRAFLLGSSLELDTFESWMQEIWRQPSWRNEADINADYYDNNQLNDEMRSALDQAELPHIVVNLIRPAIDALLGLEAKMRLDWRCVSDSDSEQEIAEGQSYLLGQAERESRADRACSDAFAGQVKTGLHWVEVSRNENPMAYPYRVRAVHRREIFWDWFAQEPDLSDARYLVRQRWYDPDVLTAFMPQHKELFQYVCRSDWQTRLDLVSRMSGPISQAGDLRVADRTSMDELRWLDMARKQIALFECWYRVWRRGVMVQRPNGTWTPYDKANPAHVIGVASGKLIPQQKVYPVLRMALFCGPHRLIDRDTNRQHFPYVPFWGYREDRTGVPHGLIRYMRSPQDEVNTRAAKLLWLLKSKRVTVENDALDTKYNTLRDLADEVQRANAMIVLNAQRKGPRGVEVESDLGLSAQQFQALAESKNNIKETAGAYNAFLGENSNVSSGIGLQTLVEQSNTVMTELSDNFRFGRRLVGERLLELVREDIGQKEIQIPSPRGNKKQYIVLNQPTVDPQTGQQYLKNDISRAGVKVALSDVPSTPAYRQQQLTMLADVTKGMPQNVQALLAPALMELTDLPDRKTYAEQMRRALGLQGELSEDEQAAQDQQAARVNAMQQELALRAQLITLDEGMAKVRKLNAEAAKLEAAIAGLGEEDPGKAALEEQREQIVAQLQGEIMGLKQQLRDKTSQIESHAALETFKATLQHEDKALDREHQLRMQANAPKPAPAAAPKAPAAAAKA